MKKIFVINGGQPFAHSLGRFNHTLTELDMDFFNREREFELRVTEIHKGYDPAREVNNYVWADTVIYHFPVWWFALPYQMKQYIDVVFTAGHRKGMYYSDGRKQESPDINYGTGGMLAGRRYMVTTSWNAPATAFTLPGEFFDRRSVDEGVLFGFHRMNAFLSLSPIPGIHFHDLEKNVTQERVDRYKEQYLTHLKEQFFID